MTAPLKAALIVDDESLGEHHCRLLEWARSTQAVCISHSIIQQRDPPPRPALPIRLLRKSPALVAAQTLWKLKHRLEARHAAASTDGGSSLERVRQAVPGRLLVKPRISPSRFVYRYGEEDLEKIRGERFDLLIRGGLGILRGGILESARLGILSFHHGENRVNRGGPAGFWEVYSGWSTTGFVVQRLTEELDGGDVVLRGSPGRQARRRSPSGRRLSGLAGDYFRGPSAATLAATS